MVHNATQNGYSALIVNHLVPKSEETKDLRCLDFSSTHVMHDVMKVVRKEFPDSEVDGVGFSLGGNYLLKAVGAPNEEGKTCDFKAVVTIA